MNARIQELRNAQEVRNATMMSLIGHLMRECELFREKIRKNEEELKKWRSDIEKGLRDDVEKADEFEKTNESLRAEVEKHEGEVQDFQNVLARPL